jgi:hypothetical protein
MSAIDEAVVVLCVRIRKPGVTRKVSTADVRVRSRKVADDAAQDADENTLRITKELIDSTEYAEIGAHDGAIRGFLRSQSLPTRLGAGEYLVPLALLEKIDARLASFAAERDALVETFLAAYPALVEVAKGTLKDLYDAGDYLAPEAMRAAFDLTTSIKALPIPGAGLARLSEALYSRELAKVETARKIMVEEIQSGIRVATLDLVGSLVDQLAPKNGETPKVLACNVEKLQAFVRDFSALNVAGDKELEKIVEEARNVIAGAKPSALRASVKAREEVAAKLATVRDALEGMISADASTLRGAALELGDAPVSVPTAPEAASTARAAVLEIDGALTPVALVSAAAQEPSSIPTVDEIMATIPANAPSGRWRSDEARREMAQRDHSARIQRARKTAEKAKGPEPRTRRLDMEDAQAIVQTVEVSRRASALELD